MMNFVNVLSVGDGLTMAISDGPEAAAQIDWGGSRQEEVYEARERFHSSVTPASKFILSHQHADHYKGLKVAAGRDSKAYSFEEVLYPRIPDFDRREEFTAKLFALNLRMGVGTLGKQTGLADYELICAINKISQHIVIPRPLSEKSKFYIGDSLFEVIWPPTDLDEEQTTSRINDALDAFSEALDEDRTLQIIFSEVEGIVEATSVGDDQEYTNEGAEEEPSERKYIETEEASERRDYVSGKLDEIQKRLEKETDISDRESIPNETEYAADKIRCAADDYSLVFVEESGSFLFLGDHRPTALNEICDTLINRNIDYIKVLKTSHHGTRSGHKLESLSCGIAVTSAGNQRSKDFEKIYSDISGVDISTFDVGDILISIPAGLSRYTIEERANVGEDIFGIHLFGGKNVT